MVGEEVAYDLVRTVQEVTVGEGRGGGVGWEILGWGEVYGDGDGDGDGVKAGGH